MKGSPTRPLSPHALLGRDLSGKHHTHSDSSALAHRNKPDNGIYGLPYQCHPGRSEKSIGSMRNRNAGWCFQASRRTYRSFAMRMLLLPLTSTRCLRRRIDATCTGVCPQKLKKAIYSSLYVARSLEDEGPSHRGRGHNGLGKPSRRFEQNTLIILSNNREPLLSVPSTNSVTM